MIETDFLPLKGLKFNCLEGCGFCCTFQPSLLRNEEKFYQNNRITKNGCISGTIIDPDSKDDVSFALQNKIGACIFIDTGKCKIYDIRPLKCKIFPINIFFSWRIQLNANMSCRGIWDGDDFNDLYSYGEELFSNLPKNIIRGLYFNTNKIYTDLPNKLTNYVSPHQIREKLLKYIENMKIESINDIEYAKKLLKEQLNQKRFVDLPMYLTDDLRWEVFKLKDDYIQRIQLNENGNLRIIDCIDFSKVDFKNISLNAKNSIKDYLIKIVNRDSFIDSLYQQSLMNKETSMEPLMDLAINNLSMILNFFIIRLNILAAFNNIESIDEKMIKQGIIFSDNSLI
jgi:Fe-S-cluster containining protein